MQTTEVESYARSQALVLLEDMAARLSAHRGVAATYVTASPAGAGDTQPTDCSGTALGAERDSCEWSNALKGNTELSGSAAIGAMIGGRGCIEQLAGVDPPSYRITVVWQGLSPTVEPDFACGQSLYGANGLRRAVGKVVSFASLGP
jgi:type IV pilus assembly protein PilV